MGWAITGAVGVLLLITGIVLSVRQHRWLAQAGISKGVVIEMVASRGSKGRTSYTPKVEFVSAGGHKHQFTRGYSSSPPDFRTGESVWVAYDRTTNAGRILTFGQRFGFPLILFSIGIMLIMLGAGFHLGKKWVPALYLPSEEALSVPGAITRI